MICGKISTKMSVTVLLKNNGFLSTVGEDKKKERNVAKDVKPRPHSNNTADNTRTLS
jgi:hypothetical protein